MLRPLLVATAVFSCAWACNAREPAAAKASDALGPVIADRVADIDGRPFDFSSLRGKVVMVVNVASECGNTPQYEPLQALYAKYKDKGFVVVGIPSNDFGGQEPGTPAEIKDFAQKSFGVTFPLLQKMHAKGDNIAPLYKTLTTQTAPALRGDVEWNFGKFLLDKQGHAIARFPASLNPSDPQVVAAIEKALATPTSTK